MTFWELREPQGSDYQHVQVSGRLDHPYRLPTAHCEECGETVSPLDVVLPFECPVSMRDHSLLTDHEAEIPMKEFRKLGRELVAHLRQAGVKQPVLVPGACLQPVFLDVPSVPKADFLWSDLWSGLSSIIVSERVRRLLLEQPGGGMALCPVTLRRVGKRAAASSPPIPKSGEPEDMMEHYRAGQTMGIGSYYHLIVIAQSGYPPGTEPGPVCRRCGEELEHDWTAEDSKARKRSRIQEAAWKNLTAAVLESVWDGAPVFRLAGRGTVLVTEALKTRFEQLQLTNVSFREYPMGQPQKAALSKARRGRGHTSQA